MSSCCAPSRSGADDAPPASTASSTGHPDRARGLVPVPGGTFRMGYDGPLANPGEGEGPVREVEVASYEIGALTVTNRQFAVFVKATGWTTYAERTGWSFVFDQLVSDPAAARGRAAGSPWWVAVDGATWRAPHGPGSGIGERGDHPVVHVSARDAEAYCSWVGARLPSETEWERAARGGLEGAVYPWGDEHPSAGGPTRCTIWEGDFPHPHERGPAAIGTTSARSHAPNGYGLFQAVGNVWEWTATTGDDQRRIRRGGSYLCHDSYCNRYRVAARDHSDVDDTTGNIGFRIAR